MQWFTQSKQITESKCMFMRTCMLEKELHRFVILTTPRLQVILIDQVNNSKCNRKMSHITY